MQMHTEQSQCLRPERHARDWLCAAHRTSNRALYEFSNTMSR